MLTNEDGIAVSQQERFMLSSRNCGFPHSITLLITYPSRTGVPQDGFLTTRIAELQEHFPLLYARIVDSKTRSPYFVSRGRPWEGREIVHYETFEVHGERTQEQERILRVENDRMSTHDIDEEPMWRVTRLTSPASTRTHLAISAHHEIVDGMGLLTLARALLSPSITHLPYETLDLIPALEDTISLKPGFRRVLSLIWHDLSTTFLPTCLRSLLRPPPSLRPWPTGRSTKMSTEGSWDVSLLALSPTLIPALKATGTANGVPALNMTLHMAYTLAIWIVCGQRALIHFSLATWIPKSERNAALGHAYCTGNYVSDFITKIKLRPTDPFWTVTAKLSEYFRSPAGIARARGSTGTLSYIPDPEPDAAMRDTPTPTGWEMHMLGKAKSPDPYDVGMLMSNLGPVGLPPGAEDAVWTQSASPFIAALSVNVIGHEGGLRASTVWREGAPVTREEVKEVERVFEEVLGRLVDESWKEMSLVGLSSGL
jgi:hypothetical protein